MAVPVLANRQPIAIRLSIGMMSYMIAVIGDTQRTLRAERVLLRREQNDAERMRIVADLAASRPELLIHLGDMVCNGQRRAEWTYFDRLIEPIRAAGIPLLPVLGNHDLWQGGRRAWPQVRARFPWLAERRWYERRRGRLRLLFLDTNASRMPRAIWVQQAEWFASVLVEANADPTTAGVLAFGHHPPFTNSRVIGDSIPVQRALVPTWLTSPKAIAFFSGHTHSYERFVIQGKDFVVTGGGGGPRVRLFHGTRQRHPDQVHWPSPRPFHYLLLQETATGVEVIVRGMEKRSTEVRELDRFVLPYP